MNILSRRLPAKSALPLLLLLLVGGCSQFGPVAEAPVASKHKPSTTSDVARSKEYVLVTTTQADTFRSLASEYLGDKNKDWQIADFNKAESIVPGQKIVIPLIHPNPVGVYPDGYQTVPILCYHRFGHKRDKMVVTPETFAAQMAYLRDNGYRVIPLSSLPAFLNGEAPLPKRSVVITIDDGYQSSHDVAYPILKKLGFPATIFIYSDFMNARDAMNYDEMRKMAASGLIDFQPHSKTHPHMAEREPHESTEAYQARIEEEIRVPSQKIRQQLGLPVYSFAYPYGETNDLVIAELRNKSFQIGATVHAGGNPAFSYPFRLRRTMIFGDRDMDSFIKALEVFSPATLR
jgi:peptidoglycan/xylan/chitin deacetylase (PgdA/CDA1 family)